MRETISLNMNRDFRRIYARGRYLAGGYVVIYVMKNRLGLNRLGLTVSKSFGNAVRRNRIKRLMRESYRLSEETIKKGYDFIIVARKRAEGKQYVNISLDILYVLKKLDMLM